MIWANFGRMRWKRNSLLRACSGRAPTGIRNRSYVRALMGRLGRKAGTEKRVHFHGLRNAHARELASENTPINVIQQQLGHSNLATTHVYLCKIAPQQVIETMQRREWVL
jgi:integrase